MRDMGFSRAVFFFCFVFLCTTGNLFAQHNGSDIFERVSPSVGILRVYDQANNLMSQGSAFVAAEGGILVTNAHVLDGGSYFVARFPNGMTRKVKTILALDASYDFAILQIENANIHPLALADSDELSVGQSVYAIGSPYGLENTISSGIVAGVRKMLGELHLLQITTPISEGSSGGVLVNETGQVVGVTTFMIGGGQNLNFAIPIKVVKDGLAQIDLLRLQPDEVPQKPPSVEQPALKLPASPLYTAGSDLRLLLEIGFSALQDEELRTARESFNKVIQIDSTEINAIRGMARVAYLAQENEEALIWYRRAVNLDSSDARTLFGCGLAARNLRMDSLALSMYEQALQVQPDFWEVWFELGLFHGRRGEYQQAIYALKQANHFNSGNPDILHSMGITAFALNDYERARDWLRRALELSPDSAEIMVKLGQACFRLDQLKQAQEILLRATQLDSMRGTAYLWLAITMRAQDNLAVALQYANKSRSLLDSAMDKINCLMLLGDIFLEEGEVKQAIRELREAAAMDPTNVHVHELLSRAYLRKGEHQKAMQEFEVIEGLRQTASN